MYRVLIFALFALVWAAMPVQASELVVLGETPVAEFTLPDGSVLKNAFVWRRSSEGLMIVHDDGQYFLNYKLLPDDWKAAYLGSPGEAVGPQPEDAGKSVPLDDRYKLEPILKGIDKLTPDGRNFLLRENSDETSQTTALALALLQSLLAKDADAARRVHMVIEEKGLEIEAVEIEQLFDPCATCDSEGVVYTDCPKCNGTGKCSKCEGTGKRPTGLGDNTIHCTVCRGTGVCPGCQGKKQLASRCRACSGRGQRVNSPYCEVKRDQLVHTANAIANKGKGLPITKAEPQRIAKVLKELPGLSPDARQFYLSDAYGGAMDTNILAACVIQSLVQGRMEEAKRFYLMVEAYYPEGDVLELDAYLKPCEACESIGFIERDCRACEGSGDCEKCGGDGQRDTDFLDRTIHCTTCRGSGKCTECGGDGKKSSRCSACDGLGRLFEQERAEIKLQILVEDLEDYFKKQ